MEMEMDIGLGLGAAALSRLAQEKVSTGKGVSLEALADSLEVPRAKMAPIRPWITAHGYAEQKWTPRGLELVATEVGIAESKPILGLFNWFNKIFIVGGDASTTTSATNIIRISNSTIENFFIELGSNITESRLSDQNKGDIRNKITQLVNALSGVGMLGISLKTLFGDP